MSGFSTSASAGGAPPLFLLDLVACGLDAPVGDRRGADEDVGGQSVVHGGVHLARRFDAANVYARQDPED